MLILDLYKYFAIDLLGVEQKVTALLVPVCLFHLCPVFPFHSRSRGLPRIIAFAWVRVACVHSIARCPHVPSKYPLVTSPQDTQVL